ncbi:class I SAM-dependent methyltransferase [Microbacterium sp.]|uniref:SAM-dependent methyltransferase n=1 Tax=Microbacterium sp. TaxID=51671 RepID=UPI0028126066|nr:class I SAM-dependent methyltransferase [Microbacterium sp.]
MSPSAEDAVTDAAEFWETRYLTHRDETGKMWSGRVNATVEREVTGIPPGTALELGSGEGADALWLAAQGWKVTAVDISAAALAVGQAQAEQMRLEDRIDWIRADLATWQPPGVYDLVTSAFFHAPFDFPREAILRRAAAAVAPGGQLLVVGHGPFAPGTVHGHDIDAPPLPTSDEVLAALELPEDWDVETDGFVERVVRRRDGTEVTLTDTVLRVRRGR